MTRARPVGSAASERGRAGRSARRPESAITVHGPGTGVPGASRLPGDLRRLAAEAARLHGGPVQIDVQLLSDPQIRRLNRTHLGHDWATDVVSFPLSAPDAPLLLGALAVSRDTARRESTRRGHAPYHELMLYVVHGTLHLLGHDDHAPRATARMRRAERELLAALGLPSVFARPESGRRARRARKEVP